VVSPLSGKSELDIQVDFSGGQINQSARRRTDTDVVKQGGQTVLNWQSTATGQLIPRPGREILYYTDCPRGDFIRVSTGEEFTLRFGANTVALFDLLGNSIAVSSDPTKIIWDNNTLDLITWAQAQDTIFICYPRMRPYQAVWDRTARNWSFYQFAFDEGQGAIKMPFYRRAVLGAVISFDKTTGLATLTCSQPYFSADMVGSTISIVGQQVIIKSFIASNKVTAQINYQLPDSIAVIVEDTTPFLPGMICQFASEGIKFEVGTIDATNKSIVGVLTSQLTFDPLAFPTDATTKPVVVSPLGSSTTTAVPAKADPGSPTVQWQEEFFSAKEGYPSSVSYDRGRLIFTGFPQASNAILWSQISSPNSFWIDSIASNSQPGAGADAKSAIFELVSGSSDIFFVEGWQQGQFTFTRRGVYFTPISQQYPMQPGNVTFEKISDDGVSNVRPTTIQDAILFINAGQNRIAAIRPTGSYTRPFLVQDFTDTHTDLFKNPTHITVRTGDGVRPERVVYVVNQDGGLVVGKAVFDNENLFVGWTPWQSKGPVKWVSAKGPNVFYTVGNVGNVGPFYTVQLETEQLYLDDALLINSSNGNANPPTGYGPFYKFPTGTMVTIMDGNIDYGERPIDRNGFVVFSPNEQLPSPTLVGGTFVAPVFEPFSYFQKVGDRTKRIGLNRVFINVTNATDFTLNNKVFPCQRFGDDGSAQPVLLDGSFRIRPFGRGWQQTVTVTKHRPGPFTLCELTLEVSN